MLRHTVIFKYALTDYQTSAVHFNFVFLIILLLKIFDFENLCTVCNEIGFFYLRFKIHRKFILKIFNMAASIGLLKVRICIFGFAIISYLTLILVEFVADCMVQIHQLSELLPLLKRHA